MSDNDRHMCQYEPRLKHICKNACQHLLQMEHVCGRPPKFNRPYLCNKKMIVVSTKDLLIQPLKINVFDSAVKQTEYITISSVAD